jgi:hypothetical protein
MTTKPVTGGMEWRPIETAPKDGTKILVFVPIVGDARFGHIYAVIWDDEFEVVNAMAKSHAKMYRGAWTDFAVESFGYEKYAEYKPTHWLPLPEPPQ